MIDSATQIPPVLFIQNDQETPLTNSSSPPNKTALADELVNTNGDYMVMATSRNYTVFSKVIVKLNNQITCTVITTGEM